MAEAVGPATTEEVRVVSTPTRKNTGKSKHNPRKKQDSSRNTTSGQRWSLPAAVNDPTYNRSPRELREEKQQQLEIDRRKIEEDRERKWLQHFIAKPNDLLRIDRNKLVVLKTIAKDKPNAQFLCEPCHYFCDNMAVVSSHLNKPVHPGLLKEYQETKTLKELPEMTVSQLDVVNNHLYQIVMQVGMNPADLESRRTIEVLVSDLVTSNLKGCSVRLFGSSIHGMGLKSSDVNIDLQVPTGSSPSAMLKEVSALLLTAVHFESVKEHFDCEFPYVGFVYKKSGEQCSISLNNERAVNLATLLSKYTPLDPRLTQLASLFRYWGKVTNTDKAQEGSWPAYAFYLMTIFYLQQCELPVLPVLHDMLVEKTKSEIENTMKVLNMSVDEIKRTWKVENKKNLASLWLGLLKFYAVDFNYMENTISIDSSSLIERKTKKIFIVDPFLPTRNVARSIISDVMFYYIQSCLMITCKYYCTPQTCDGALFGNIYLRATNYHPILEEILKNADAIRSQLIQINMKLDPKFITPEGEGIKEEVKEVLSKMQKLKYYDVDNIPTEHLSHFGFPAFSRYQQMLVSPAEAKMLVSNIYSDILEYQFNRINLTKGKECPIVCHVCRESHGDRSCPEEELPSLIPLPKLTEEDIEILEDVACEVFDQFRQHEQDIKARDDICAEIEVYIRKLYPTAKLELFGSTRNGFGLNDSDMDMCLIFEDNPTGEGLDTRHFVEQLGAYLKKFKAINEVLVISTAKVPIVKFTHKSTRIDGDISLYNVLAMENSKLLYTYSSIDQRVRILGYMMKTFAKVCLIGDASKGSLSSYAYTLMVIYYLQRCDPPIVPVLQELTESGDPPPTNMVEGCNAYFFKDLSKLRIAASRYFNKSIIATCFELSNIDKVLLKNNPVISLKMDKVWQPEKGKNNLSVAELWLNMLIFYTEEFDMMNNVISIRCSKTMPKFDKLWISKGIAIEDPFDLAHNLGCALTRKMSLYIIKALRKGRNHFGFPVDPLARFRCLQFYFFDVKKLTHGEPPNDRGCRYCKSIGHKFRDCPEKKKSRVKQMARKDNSPKKEVRSQTSENTRKEASGKIEPGADEEDRLRTSRHHQENHPRKSNEKHNRMRNPEFLNKPQTPDRLPQRAHAEFQNHHQQSVTSRFHAQNSTGPPHSKASPYMTYNPTSPTNSNPKTPNVRPAKTEIQPMNQSLRFSQPNADNGEHIPSFVFNNSRLPELSFNQRPPLRCQFPQSMEPVRPPPGFDHLQRPPVPCQFPQDQRAVGPKPWSFDGNPFFAPQMTRPQRVDLIPERPMHSSAPFGVNSGASPRPPVCPPFNNSNFRYPGMTGSSEQIRWGQPTPNQLSKLQSAQVSNLPYPLDNLSVRALNATVENMQLNSLPQPSITSQHNSAQNRSISALENRTENAGQNSSTQFNFPPNGKTGLNDCS